MASKALRFHRPAPHFSTTVPKQDSLAPDLTELTVNVSQTLANNRLIGTGTINREQPTRRFSLLKSGEFLFQLGILL